MGEAKLAIFPLPMGKQRFVCDRISQGELAMGNFRGYVKKNKRITYDSSWGKFYGLNKTQSGSTNHEKVKIYTKSREAYPGCQRLF